MQAPSKVPPSTWGKTRVVFAASNQLGTLTLLFVEVYDISLLSNSVSSFGTKCMNCIIWHATLKNGCRACCAPISYLVEWYKGEATSNMPVKHKGEDLLLFPPLQLENPIRITYSLSYHVIKNSFRPSFGILWKTVIILKVRTKKKCQNLCKNHTVEACSHGFIRFSIRESNEIYFTI